MKRHLAWQGILFLLLSPCVVIAATWAVEKDGSGDYTVIQDAVEASASGDTILIGPGRFDDLHSYTTPGGGWTGDVMVSIDDRDLTLIGAGQGATVIGLEVYPGTPLWPKAVVMVWEDRLLTMHNLIIENVFTGMYINGSVDVYEVEFRGGGGIISFDSPEVTINTCRFYDLANYSIVAYQGTTVLHVTDSYFRNVEIGIDTVGVESVVETCVFEDVRVGIEIYAGSMAIIRNCVISNVLAYGIGSDRYSQAEVYDCVTSGGYRAGIYVGWDSQLTGTGNEIRNSVGPAVAGDDNSHIQLNGCHILSPTNNFVALSDYDTVPFVIDMTDNYWGVTTAAEIAAGIHDGVDDPEINAVVAFAPFSGVPVGDEDLSWGDVKQIYAR